MAEFVDGDSVVVVGDERWDGSIFRGAHGRVLVDGIDPGWLGGEPAVWVVLDPQPPESRLAELPDGPLLFRVSTVRRLPWPVPDEDS